MEGSFFGRREGGRVASMGGGRGERVAAWLLEMAAGWEGGRV